MTSEERKEIQGMHDYWRKKVKREKIRFSESVSRAPNLNEIIEAARNFDGFYKEDDEMDNHQSGFFTVNGISYFFSIEFPGLMICLGHER